jgi:hypothetical protein
MSATSAPRGLKPIGLLGGMPFAGSTREFLIKSGYATAIFNGDVVGLADTANSTDDGYLVREAVASEVNPIGVFLGCSYTDPSTGQLTFKQYYPGASLLRTSRRLFPLIHSLFTNYKLTARLHKHN